MRVLLDANILVSYLLNPQTGSPIRDVVEATFVGRYVLLLPEQLLDEFAAKIVSKPDLAGRIAQEEMLAFKELLERVGESIPAITNTIPAVTRDPKDDYLLAYAVVGQADYLVTGDTALLVLHEVGGITICTPRTFIDERLEK